MFATLQHVQMHARRFTNGFSHAKLLQWPKQQWAQTKHCSSKAPTAKKRHRWTDAETRRLVDYVYTKFLSNNFNPDWKKVSKRFRHLPQACMNKYYLVRKDYLMDNEVDLMDSKIMAKTVFASSRNAMSTKRKWTADEVARLREARGTSQYCGGWDKVVEHVSNGRTKTQCMNKWNDLRIADKCAALQQDDTDPAIAQNGTTNSRTGKWTPEEVTQLKALMESPPDRSKPRLHIAHAMFPHKSIVQVHLKLKNLKRFEIRLEQSTRLPMVREKLRRMVSSHGGVEKADWKTISEVVGETIYQCQRIYDDMLKLKYGKLNWKPDEVDRLVAATHSQQGNAGDYDWNVIANAMETRTKRQCYLKFYRLSRTKRDTAGQESYCVKIPT